MNRRTASLARREELAREILKLDPDQQTAALMLMDVLASVGADREISGSAWLSEIAVTTPWLEDWVAERVSRRAP